MNTSPLSDLTFTYDQQLHELQYNKGLIINDLYSAKRALKDIGYFLLFETGKSPFMDLNTLRFHQGVSFEDIYTFYQFDIDLRELFFRYLCKIECKMKQLISYQFSQLYGQDQSAYLDINNYQVSTKNIPIITNLHKLLSYQAYISNEHSYISHQRNVFGHIPLRMLIHTLTFGQVSKFFSVSTFKLQSAVSKNFPDINEKELMQYLKILTLFRNVCAHNERLSSYRLQIDFPDTYIHQKLCIPKKGAQYIYGKRDLFGLVIAFYLLLSENEYSDFKISLEKLLELYESKSKRIKEVLLPEIICFPYNWNEF